MEVRIDDHDLWSLDHSLALIIHPALIKLKAAKHGAPYVDDEDVPDNLKTSAAPATEHEWDVDENFFLRWDWVMDEMIWTFDELSKDDPEEQFFSYDEKPEPPPPATTYELADEYIDFDSFYDSYFSHYLNEEPVEPSKDPTPKKKKLKTPRFDKEAYDIHEARIKNGLRLFGKYYRGLWN